MDHLSRALAQAERDDAHVAVLFLDLARLKLVNDSYGPSGDRHLCGVAFSGREDAEHRVAHADTAMYRAKEIGRARHEVYNEDVSEAAARRPLMERTLRAAPTLS